MKLIKIMTTAAVVTVIAGGAWAGNDNVAPKGNANGVYGCNSGSAQDAKNPGQWLKALKGSDSPLNGLNPAEIAEATDNSTGWFGSGETPNVGALVDVYCGPDQPS
jgi:hypothetical protein